MKKSQVHITMLFATVVLAVSCASTPPPPAPVVEQAPPKAEKLPPPADTTGPELRVTFSPKYFSPNGDKDELAIFLFATDESPIGKWKAEVHEPEPPYILFYEWAGEGTPPNQLSWNGKSSKGELVQSAIDYPFIFTASDVWGNSTTIQSQIEVDVFVIKEGDNLRIQIPSIVFSSNAGTWEGLNTDIVTNNDLILRRIAQILNKFPTYKVNVEGHANPTVNPSDTAGRQLEEVSDLLPLSKLRAMNIVSYLTKLGINPDRLSASGIGGQKPIAAWDDKDNWWKNRRVEFLLTKP